MVGPGEGATPEQCDAAYAVGAGLAAAGAVLLCGGLGGVMRAAAAGATAAGGVAVGLLPGTDRSAAAPELTVALATGLGELRNGVLVRCADAVVAVGGSWGTLSEIALARRSGVPLVLLDPWPLPEPAGVVVSDPSAAVAAVAELLASPG